jgi:excisionase family DNA binding protein
MRGTTHGLAALDAAEPPATAFDEPLLTAREVADWLKMSTHRVLDFGQDGTLPSLKLGGGSKGAVRFRRSDLEAYLESCSRPARRGPLVEVTA